MSENHTATAKRWISPEEFKRVNAAVATLYPFGRATARLGAYYIRRRTEAFETQHFGFMVQLTPKRKYASEPKFLWAGLEPDDVEKAIAKWRETLETVLTDDDSN